MNVHVLNDPDELARTAAVSARGVAHVMFASGNSQLAFLDVLVGSSRVAWDRVIGFHMDEYVGVGAGHSASFARYMRERIVDRVSPRAITVTIPALLRTGSVMVIAPDRRKAIPVAAALEGPISAACPASVLQRTPHAHVFLEPAAAAGLRTSQV